MSYEDYRARQDAALKDPRVQAVREHELVGRGSCTSIDECYEHTELVEAFDQDGVETPEAAVAWALKVEGLWRDKGADASSGEPDCPLVESAREWREVTKEVRSCCFDPKVRGGRCDNCGTWLEDL